MAYGGGLENRFRLLANVGSNPTPSAVFAPKGKLSCLTEKGKILPK